MEINTLGVIGAGQMGNGITQIAAVKGLQVPKFCPEMSRRAR